MLTPGEDPPELKMRGFGVRRHKLSLRNFWRDEIQLLRQLPSTKKGRSQAPSTVSRWKRCSTGPKESFQLCSPPRALPSKMKKRARVDLDFRLEDGHRRRPPAQLHHHPPPQSHGTHGSLFREGKRDSLSSTRNFHESRPWSTLTSCEVVGFTSTNSFKFEVLGDPQDNIVSYVAS